MPEGLAEKMKLCARPKFQIWKGGQMMKEVDGVLIDEIENTVNNLLPSVDDG